MRSVKLIVGSAMLTGAAVSLNGFVRSPVSPQEHASIEQQVPSIADVLDDFHAAAAAAEEDRYFAHFAPDAVFLGTDPSERWTVDEFRAYARPHFDRGRGWAYHAIERHIQLAPGGAVGWFDEVVRNAKYGDLRGTGVVMQMDGKWKIAQYNLTFTIPNERAPEVLELLAAQR